MTYDKYAAMLFPLVESCIPEEILRAWLRSPLARTVSDHTSVQENTYNVKLKQLLSFLRTEVEGEERISMAKSGFMIDGTCEHFSVKNRQRHDEFVPTANNLFSGESQKKKMWTCVFCDKTHESKECFVAQKLPLSKKRDILSEKKACFLCFKIGHRSKDCNTKMKCMICERRHYTIMCSELPSNVEKEQDEQRERRKPSNVLTNQCCSQEVLLQTLLVKLEANGTQRTVRAMIDCGSQRSYILKKTVTAMKYSPVGTESLVQILFGGIMSKRETHQRYHISLSSLQKTFSCNIPVLDQPTICGRLRHGPWTEELISKGIHINDVGEELAEIEVLIGADVAGSLLTGKTSKLRSGLVAVETLLGWVIMGKIQGNNGNDTQATVVTTLLSHSNRIENLWNLDLLGIKDPVEVKTKEEMELAILDHFEKAVTINSEGRYEVKLPWTENQDDLKDNRVVAERRLESTTSRLICEGKYEDYNAVFNEWEQEGVIEEISEREQDDRGHYLPHRGVFKSGSTTNVRPVFDASSKKKGCPSLNDCLEKGPNLLELIPLVLMRFREKKLGVISDIKRAFLQIAVKFEDREFLRFLWWQDYEKRQVKIFRHRRVDFGVNCSPFLLGAVINHHLNKCAPELRNVAEKLKKSFYVDNCVTSVDSEEELNQFVQDSTKLMMLGKFELRGWENTAMSKNRKAGHSFVLGLAWDQQEDVLYCDLKEMEKTPTPVTRRNILSATQRVFDPIGFTCPVTVIPKLLLQESWKSKLSWDDEVPEDLQTKFVKWMDELPKLSSVKVPRCISPRNCKTTYSLHTFCDASKSCYAAVVYLRSEDEQVTSVQLLQAMSRVAPLKKITIPRLELLACCIGGRLAAYVKEVLDLSDVRLYFWTDSSTALCWIKREEPWGIFVGNRVKEIRSITKPEDWRHIPGQYNPADLPSRGCSTTTLMESRWWEGPTWLKLKPRDWPTTTIKVDEEVVGQEMRKGVVASLTSASKEEGWYLTYFSSFTKILRMVAWILRFAVNVRKEPHARKYGYLLVSEIAVAERKLLKLVQLEAFHEGKGSSLKSLCTFEDKDGIIRVETKLTRREDTDNFKYPIVLPNDHKLVKLLIQEEHVKMCHGGLHVLLSRLREKFWILKGRRTVRGVIAKCVRCRRYESRKLPTTPVTLPEDRVKDALVFEVTGVDLAGPLILKGGEKAWILLLTCAVYRAVHLELIMSLSTNSFMMGLRRFIARCGRPKIIYSDNGTNFVGTENLFKSLDWEKIESETSVLRIHWKFNPPTAAWWGGWWERLIQMTKKLLRHVLGRSSLYYEEMLSILCDCESVINSRPLTYMSEDPDDLIPLSPAMFLQDVTTVDVPDLDHLDNVNLSKRFRYQQTLRDDLRKRFRSEYLSQLIQRPGGKESQQVLTVGDVVLVGSDSQKRMDWSLAKVIQLYPGRDGVVRVVRLKTSSGEMVRPTQRLYPLEISASLEPLETAERADDVASGTATPAPVVEKVLTTRSGRQVKVPSKFWL